MDKPQISRLKAENAELKTLLAAAEAKAAIDNLTGLPNESVVEMTLERELGEVKREKQKRLDLKYSPDNIKKIIERINDSANSVNCSKDPENKIPLTTNIGGVIVHSNSNLFTSEILKAADINLYQSKNHEHSDATISIMGKEV